jgi:hypothetical protein
LVASDVRQLQAQKAVEVASNIRRYRAPSGEIARYLRSRDAITEPETAAVESAVTIFLPKFKRMHWKHPHPLRQLAGAEIPGTVTNALVAGSTAKGSRKIVRAFNASEYYARAPDPLPPPLPDVESVRRFHAFVAEQSGRAVFDDWAAEEPVPMREKRPPRPPLYVL